MARYALLLVASCVAVGLGQFCDEYCGLGANLCKKVTCDYTTTTACAAATNLPAGSLDYSPETGSCLCQDDQSCATPPQDKIVPCPVSTCASNSNDTRNGVCFFTTELEFTGETCVRDSDKAQGYCIGGYCIDMSEIEYFNTTELSIDFATDDDAKAVIEFPSDSDSVVILTLNPTKSVLNFDLPDGLVVTCYGWNVTCTVANSILRMAFQIPTTFQQDYIVYNILLGIKKDTGATTIVDGYTEILVLVPPGNLPSPVANSNVAKWLIGGTEYSLQSTSLPSVVSGTSVLLKNVYCPSGLATFIDQNDNVLAFGNTTQFFGLLPLQARGFRFWAAYAVCTNLFTSSQKVANFAVNLTLVSNSNTNLKLTDFANLQSYHQGWLYAASMATKPTTADIDSFLDGVVAALVGAVESGDLTIYDITIQDLIYASQFVYAGQQYLVEYFNNTIDCEDLFAGEILYTMEVLNDYYFTKWASYPGYDALAPLLICDYATEDTTGQTAATGVVTNAGTVAPKKLSTAQYFLNYRQTRTVMAREVQNDFQSRPTIIDGTVYTGNYKAKTCAVWCFVKNPTFQGSTSKQICSLTSSEKLTANYTSYAVVNQAVNASQGPVIVLMKLYDNCAFEKDLNANQTSAASYHVFAFKPAARRAGNIGKKPKKAKKKGSLFKTRRNTFGTRRSKFVALQTAGFTFSVSGIPVTGAAADSKCQQRDGNNTKDAGVSYTAATTTCTLSLYGLDNPIVLVKASAPAVQGLPVNGSFNQVTLSFKAGSSLTMSWTILVLILALAFVASSF